MDCCQDNILGERHKQLCCKVEKKIDVCLLDLRRELIEAMRRGTEIELLTAATPPAGRPPNITGVIIAVGSGTIRMRLTSGPPNRIGVYSICHIIGFVPRGADDLVE